MNSHNAVGKTGSVYILIPGGKSGLRKIQITFQGAIRVNDTYSEVIISRSRNAPIIVYARLIKNNGQIKGVIGVSIDLGI